MPRWTPAALMRVAPPLPTSRLAAYRSAVERVHEAGGTRAEALREAYRAAGLGRVHRVTSRSPGRVLGGPS